MSKTKSAASTHAEKKYRIAVLGNSHASCLKRAWDDMGNTHERIASITFFARGQGEGGVKDLIFEADCMRAGTPELSQWFMKTAGTDIIAFKDYDAFVLAAFGVNSESFCKSDLKTQGQTFSKNVLDIVARNYRRQVMDGAEENLVKILPPEIRKRTDAKIFVFQKPLVSEQLEKYAQAGEFAGFLYRNYVAEMTDLLASSGSLFISQPPETIARGCFTRSEYAKPDLKHATDEYGRLMLERMAARLD